MSKKIITMLALLSMLMPVLCVRAADTMPGIEELMDHLPFQNADLEKLLAGEIVSYDLEPGSDKELSIVVRVIYKQVVPDLFVRNRPVDNLDVFLRDHVDLYARSEFFSLH